MARHKDPGEMFCRSCGVAIDKRGKMCPHCGVATKTFPGFEPASRSSSPRSSGGSTFDRWVADVKMRDRLGPMEPYTEQIGMVGGIILALFGVLSLFSSFVTPGSLLLQLAGSMLMIAGGAFALPQVRDEIRPELAETSIETPLDPGVVAYISILLYVLGWLLTV